MKPFAIWYIKAEAFDHENGRALMVRQSKYFCGILYSVIEDYYTYDYKP